MGYFTLQSKFLQWANFFNWNINSNLKSKTVINDYNISINLTEFKQIEINFF